MAQSLVETKSKISKCDIGFESEGVMGKRSNPSKAKCNAPYPLPSTLTIVISTP